MRKILFICTLFTCSVSALFSQDAALTALKGKLSQESRNLAKAAQNATSVELYKETMDAAAAVLDEYSGNDDVFFDIAGFKYLITHANPDSISEKQKQAAIKYFKKMKHTRYADFSDTIWLDRVGVLDELLKNEDFDADRFALLLIKAKKGDPDALKIVMDKIDNMGFCGEKIDHEKIYAEARENEEYDIQYESWHPTFWDALYIGTPELLDKVIKALMSDEVITFKDEGRLSIKPCYDAALTMQDVIIGFPNIDDYKLPFDEYIQNTRNWIMKNRSSLKLKKYIPFETWKAYTPKNIDSLK